MYLSKQWFLIYSSMRSIFIQSFFASMLINSDTSINNNNQEKHWEVNVGLNLHIFCCLHSWIHIEFISWCCKTKNICCCHDSRVNQTELGEDRIREKEGIICNCIYTKTTNNVRYCYFLVFTHFESSFLIIIFVNPRYSIKVLKLPENHI